MAYRDRRLSLTDLPLSHVVSCTPCFQQYLRFRRTLVFVRGLQATVASLVVLGVLFTGERVSRSRWPRSPDHFAEACRPIASDGGSGASTDCSACDQCKLGLLFADPRRGRQAPGESGTLSRLQPQES